MESQFVLNGEDMFIDDDAPTVRLLNRMRMSLIGRFKKTCIFLLYTYLICLFLSGVEHIVEDRTNDEIKCMLCRVLLKTTTLVDHLKSYKHQQLYLVIFCAMSPKCHSN